MLIDWFTVLAQIVNFLILVWLLKRFLYRPILDGIDAREKQIAAVLADAGAKKLEAQKERDAFQHKSEALDRQRAALLIQATEEAKAERARLLDAARQEADALRAKRQEALRSEQQSLDDALASRAREEVFAIARKVLTDLAGTTLEERMTEVFLHRWHELYDADRDELKSAFTVSSSPLLVRTAFSLPSAQRTDIETAIKATLGGATNVRFDTTPDLVSGIEVSMNGQKVAWSVADYLASLSKSAEEVMKAQTTPEATSRPTGHDHGV